MARRYNSMKKFRERMRRTARIQSRRGARMAPSRELDGVANNSSVNNSSVNRRWFSFRPGVVTAAPIHPIDTIVEAQAEEIPVGTLYSDSEDDTQMIPVAQTINVHNGGNRKHTKHHMRTKHRRRRTNHHRRTKHRRRRS